jgi:hypothetical protein
MTNKEFAEKDPVFRKACENCGVRKDGSPLVPPTPRQASKWRRQTGRAWKEGRGRSTEL